VRRLVGALARGGLAPLWSATTGWRVLRVSSEFVTLIFVEEAAQSRRGPKRRQGGALQGDARFRVLSCMVARRLFPAYLHLIETVSNNAKNPDS